jgi:hypothetical protein
MNEDNFKILGQKSFEEMDLPNILYKYRDWNIPNHRRILSENEVYLSSPGDFEDEFDCKIPIRYDLLTNKDIFEKYLNLSKKENPLFNRQQHRQFARDWQKKGLMKDKNRLEKHDKDFFTKFNNLFGVLSLTAIPNNIVMWDYYANHHTGFCIGFNTIPLFNLSEFFGGGGEVTYFDELPIIKETDSFEKKHFLQINSKLRKWEFEKEYRLTKFKIQNRQVKLPNEIFAEIILGAKLSGDAKNEIIRITSQKFPNAKILQAIIENGLVIIKQI